MLFPLVPRRGYVPWKNVLVVGWKILSFSVVPFPIVPSPTSVCCVIFFAPRRWSSGWLCFFNLFVSSGLQLDGFRRVYIYITTDVGIGLGRQHRLRPVFRVTNLRPQHHERDDRQNEVRLLPIPSSGWPRWRSSRGIAIRRRCNPRRRAFPHGAASTATGIGAELAGLFRIAGRREGICDYQLGGPPSAVCCGWRYLCKLL